MYCFKFLSLQVAVVHIFILTAFSYEYAEIQKWNASCTPKDTCSIPRDLDDSEYHNCDCSSLCVLYDTCCIDSPFLNISSKYERHASCRAIGQSDEYVFMVDSCPNSYEGPLAIRRRCDQNVKDWSDPFNNVPVTHPFSQKTYKSLFCAICNGENPKELVMWHVMLDCSSLKENMKLCTDNKEFVLNNMMYIREKGLWGLWSYDSETDWMFRFLHISLRIPDSIKKSVRECRANLVSDCPHSWRDNKVQELCEAYMGVVYYNSTAYRNVHCAICNYERNISARACHDLNKLEYKGPAMNFGLLLDIDLTDGDKIGTVEVKCETDQVYDPFSKKCRTIECPLPGFVLKNGKCAHVS